MSDIKVPDTAEELAEMISALNALPDQDLTERCLAHTQERLELFLGPKKAGELWKLATQMYEDTHRSD